MELRRTEQGFALYKEKDCIGECTLSPAPKGAQLAALCILPRWRRKGYGSYLLKEVLRSFGGYDRETATVFTAPLPENAAEKPDQGEVLPYLPPRCPPMPQSLRSGQSSALRQKAGSWCAAAPRT